MQVLTYGYQEWMAYAQQMPKIVYLLLKIHKLFTQHTMNSFIIVIIDIMKLKS